jgi:hypothetical protein
MIVAPVRSGTDHLFVKRNSLLPNKPWLLLRVTYGHYQLLLTPTAMSMSEQFENVSDREPTPQDNTGLQIPESRDGFFGYPEEKSLQHVRVKLPIRLVDNPCSYFFIYGLP